MDLTINLKRVHFSQTISIFVVFRKKNLRSCFLPFLTSDDKDRYFQVLSHSVEKK